MDNHPKLTASYLHVQRALDVIGYSHSLDTSNQGAFISLISGAMARWLNKEKPPTLGQLLASKKIQLGTVFSHLGPFYFRGMTNYLLNRRVDLPSAYAKLDDFHKDMRLEFSVNPEHLTSNSAKSDFMGQKRLFFVGLVTELKKNVIFSKPILIGHVMSNVFASGPELMLPAVEFHGEVYFSQIDSFSEAATLRPANREKLQVLREISEQQIKEAFAEIIGEPFIPKDWGGEISDLFSTRIALEGSPVATAFLFKGPAKFHPLTVADLGKNGDQIYRLFNEPAELLIVQHCHQITTAIRAHMRAFATQVGNRRRFALIDGADTLRILCAYKKLGFLPTGHRS